MSLRFAVAHPPFQFSCLVLVLTVLLSAPIGLAQTTAVPSAPGKDRGMSYAVTRSPVDNGYWMVSTHASPQSFSRERPQFRPCVTRVDSGCIPRQASFADMCESLTPGVPVCIFVHGSFVSSRDMETQSALTNHWLRSASRGQSMHMINFTWPSDRPMLSPTVKLDVDLLGRRAARNGWYLADLVRYISPQCPVCMIGHSHGCRTIASSLHLMGGGSVQGVTHLHARGNGRLIRTVFAASAMRHDWLNPGERYGRAFCSSNCLINFKNRQDPALMLYPLRHPFSGHSLGIKGFSHRDRRSLGNWSSRVQDCDVTELVGCQHMWPRYLQFHRLAWVIRNFVFFSDVRKGNPVTFGQQAESATQDYRPGHSVFVDEPG